MRKKILCAAMTMVMIVGVLSGCGKKNDYKNTEKEKVTESVTDVVAETEAVTESIEEKDEYLTIDTSTICSRELHDFFELYLRCWIDWSFKSGKLNTGGNAQPTSIKNMMTHTGVVGAFTSSNGMRIVSDYKEDDFSGLSYNNLLDFTSPFSDYPTVNYSCSVSCLESNFSSFRYKEGTDAVLKMFVKVNYNLSAGGNSNDKSDLFAIELVDSADNPKEWLIRYISTASDSFNAIEREKYPDCNYVNNNGAAIDDQYYFTADKLINEDKEIVDTSNMTGWKKEYINYIYGLDDKVTGYKFLDANSEGEPKLYIEYAEGTEAELLIYTKGGIVQSISATDNYNEFAYGDGKIVESIMRAGTAAESVYSYNESIDRFDLIFEGTYDDYDTDTPNNYCLVAQGTGQEERVTKEEYESKLKEARGNTEYTELMGDCLTDDVISAIQNY